MAAMGLDDVVQEVGRELAKNERPCSCIPASALLISVLHRRGFHDAYRLTVKVQIFNRIQWLKTHGLPNDEASCKAYNDAGGAFVSVGEGEVPDGHWSGHLVVIVPNTSEDQHTMLDLTIDQAHKPEWDIDLLDKVLRIEVDDQFVSGKAPRQCEVNGLLLIYRAYPDDDSYRDRDF